MFSDADAHLAHPRATLPLIRAVSPSLADYTDRVLLEDVWKRPQLSARDRSLATLAVLIARNQSNQLPQYLDLALDSDVKPLELSGLIAHLAFYSGWANATAAVYVTHRVFERRGIDAQHLRPPGAASHSLDLAKDERRHALVENTFGEIAPQLVQLTRDVVFRNLWLRPELSTRDRCLITICSVIATAQMPQLPFYLNRAIDEGFGHGELSELMTHVAFYAGWSSAYTALSVLKSVFVARPVGAQLASTEPHGKVDP